MTITTNLNAIHQVIRQAEWACCRPSGSVRLLAVSKQQPVEAITEVFDAGQHAFGESYLQEALLKIQALANLPIQWHFIGRIQRNKVKAIAQHFSWVHTVSRHDIAEGLNAARPLHIPPLNVCIQLNIDDEETKAGIHPADVAALASHILTLPRLILRGLMVIPKPEDNMDKQMASFLRVAECMHAINQQLNISMDTLSMGMSHDFETAIYAGSTMVRIGTAIFGERVLNPKSGVTARIENNQKNQ